MKSTHTKFLLMGAFLASIIFIGVGAAPVAPKPAPPSGDDRYMPTKREWLALWGHAHLAVPKGEGKNEFLISIITDEKPPNSVVIRCIYGPTVNLGIMNNQIGFTRRILESQAKLKHWDWLKVEEQSGAIN